MEARLNGFEKFNEHKINKSIVGLSLAKILTTLISTITSMLLARFRTLQEYGTYSQMLLCINLSSSLFMLGLPNSINYFLGRAENDEERKKFINVYYTLNTLLSFVLGLSLTLSVNLISKYFSNPLITSFMYFLAFYPWTRIINNSVENVLVVYKRTGLLLIVKVVHNLSVLILVLLFQLLRLDFGMYMIVFVLVEACFTFFYYLLIKIVTGTLKLSFNFKIIKTILFFSIPIGLASVVGTLNVELDKFLIGKLFTTEQLAIFSACSTELPLNIISASITAVALPVMAHLFKIGDYCIGVEKWKKSVIFSFSIICIFSLGMYFFADDAVCLLFSQKYISGSNVFKIYALTLLLKCTYFGMILNSLGKTKLILFSSIGTLVLNISLNIVFYYLFGFEGPAIATLISMLAMQMFQLFFSAKYTSISFTKIFPWVETVGILLLNIFLGIIFQKIKDLIPLDAYVGSIAETIILCFCWFLVYLLLIFKRMLKIFKEL